MAIVDDTEQQRPEGPSTLLQIALLVALSIVAIAIGAGAGLYLSSRQAAPEDAAAIEALEAEEVHLAEAQEALGIVYLEPLTTNMAGPTETWVRLEAALVFDGPVDVTAAQSIQQDMLTYLRTVKIHQVEGASGFQHLKSDLEERAALLSDGKVTNILIRTLLFE